MLRRDDYIKMLEKRASDFDGGKTGPTYDHDVNSDQIANDEHQKNLSDNRQTLGSIFANMGEASRVETRFAKKWFPSERFEKDTSSPLIKVAMAVLSQSEAFAGYPPHYKAAAVSAFTDELEKISNAVGMLAPQVLGGVVGHNYGKKQVDRGEPYNFGVRQVGSLLIPGGLGYQVGRGIAHSKTKQPAEPAQRD